MGMKIWEQGFLEKCFNKWERSYVVETFSQNKGEEDRDRREERGERREEEGPSQGCSLNSSEHKFDQLTEKSEINVENSCHGRSSGHWRRRWRRKQRRSSSVSFEDLRDGGRFIYRRDRFLELQQEQFCCVESSRVRSSLTSHVF